LLVRMQLPQARAAAGPRHSRGPFVTKMWSISGRLLLMPFNPTHEEI
jgi:hypothetical protein